ncbi:bifunctional phosphopantothenoylcysteine decarboxylase/phosphopantothenate--cysteine ligase CoaBC [Mycoplasmatota bacterium WC44]
MKIILGVTSSIAVYKAISIASELKKRGVEVYTVMTKNAAKLVSPIIFETITGNKAYVDLFEDDDHTKVTHVYLTDEIDAVLVAPATYNIVGKVASGIADDFLTTLISASKVDVYFALAMNVKMYENKILQDNLEKLKGYGYKFIEPEEGYLACGYEAKGRLASIESIVDTVLNGNERILSGKKVLITAGATRAYIDPIRFISNKSTGKMGYSLGSYASKLGAEVTVISANVSIEQESGINYIDVETVDEMDKVLNNEFDSTDYLFMTAAVSDYKVDIVADKKIKKSDDDWSLDLVRTNDLLANISKNKKESQTVIGFAAESDNLEKNAIGKLNRKKLDYIVANHTDNFASDSNEVKILSKEEVFEIKKASKDIIAKEIIDYILKG